MTEQAPSGSSDELETRPASEPAGDAEPAEDGEPIAAAEPRERRRYPRRGIRDLPLVQPVLGEVVNMSAGGISVLSYDALPVHKELFLSFGPPGQRVRVRARVVWCRLRATEAGVDWLPKYRAGIQFLEFPS